MTNKILHTVTNRATFTSPVFPAITSFVPRTQSEDATAVREFLQMSFNTHDYYVVGLLQAIDAIPDIKWEFGTSPRTYDLKHYQYPKPWSTGAKLGPDAGGPPVVNRTAAEWPVFFDIYATYLDDTHLRVTGGKHNDIVKARRNNDFVIVEWPEWTGLSGTLQNLDPGWSAGFEFHLYHIPNNFPYPILAEKLLEQPSVYQLLIQQGLESAFYSARTTLEKVATVALALGKSYALN